MSVAFERGGLVMRITADEGDKVKKAAVLTELDTARLKANRQELVARKSKLQAGQHLAMATMQPPEAAQEPRLQPEITL